MTLGVVARDWILRLVGVAAFVGAAALIYVLSSLPVATRSETKAPWTAMRGETLTVGLAPAATGPDKPLVALNGAPGQDMSVTLVRAKFTPKTQAVFHAIPNLAGFADRSPAVWLAHKGGGGRSLVTVTLLPSGPNPALSLTPTATGRYAEMALRAHDARLVLGLSAALDPAAPPPEVLGPNGAWALRIKGAGGFPVEAMLPADAPAVIRIPQASAADSEFRMGDDPATGQPAILFARTLRIRAVQGAAGAGEDRLRACGADAKAISWTSTQVGLSNCEATLRIVDVSFDRNTVGVEVNGPAFVAADGKTEVLPLKKVTDNPIISIALGTAYAGFVAWALRTVFRRRPTAAEPPPA